MRKSVITFDPSTLSSLLKGKKINPGRFIVTLRLVVPHSAEDKELVFIDQNRKVNLKHALRLAKNIDPIGFAGVVVALKTTAWSKDQLTPQLVIADGQHRIIACRETNTPYLLMELEPRNATERKRYHSGIEVLKFIASLNTKMRKWSAWQFITSFAGFADPMYKAYQFMVYLKETYELQQGDVAHLCTGHPMNFPEEVKEGTFSMNEVKRKEAEKLAKILQDITVANVFGSKALDVRMKTSIVKVLREFANSETYRITYTQGANFILSRGVGFGFNDPIQFSPEMVTLEAQLQMGLIQAHDRGFFAKKKRAKK